MSCNFFYFNLFLPQPTDRRKAWTVAVKTSHTDYITDFYVGRAERFQSYIYMCMCIYTCMCAVLKFYSQRSVFRWMERHRGLSNVVWGELFQYGTARPGMYC